MWGKVLSTIGMAFGLFGFLILFRFGMPYRVETVFSYARVRSLTQSPKNPNFERR
jgi:hypothetical protein